METQNADCKCEFCSIDKRMSGIIQRRDPDEMAGFIKELAIMWLNADNDRNYYMSIIDGSWPQAEEILIASLEKARKCREQNS